MMVLGKENSQGKTYISGSGNSDPISAFYRKGGGGRLGRNKQICYFKIQYFSQFFYLFDRRNIVLTVPGGLTFPG